MICQLYISKDSLTIRLAIAEWVVNTLLNAYLYVSVTDSLPSVYVSRLGLVCMTLSLQTVPRTWS